MLFVEPWISMDNYVERVVKRDLFLPFMFFLHDPDSNELDEVLCPFSQSCLSHPQCIVLFYSLSIPFFQAFVPFLQRTRYIPLVNNPPSPPVIFLGPIFPRLSNLSTNHYLSQNHLQHFHFYFISQLSYISTSPMMRICKHCFGPHFDRFCSFRYVSQSSSKMDIDVSSPTGMEFAYNERASWEVESDDCKPEVMEGIERWGRSVDAEGDLILVDVEVDLEDEDVEMWG